MVVWITRRSPLSFASVTKEITSGAGLSILVNDRIPSRSAMLPRRTALSPLARTHQRSLSSRAQQVLAGVGLPTDGKPIPGLYDGAWGGSGAELKSTCPATGEVLARVTSVSMGRSEVLLMTVGDCCRDARSHSKDERGGETSTSYAGAKERRGHSSDPRSAVEQGE